MIGNVQTHEDQPKQEWQTPELIDLGDGLGDVAGGLGALNDGVVEAIS